MSRMMTWWTVAAAIGLLAATPAHAQQKIVFIDLDRAFSEFYKTRMADTQLKEQADEFNEERQKLVEEFQKLQEAFNEARDEAQSSALSDEALAEKRDAAEEKLVELREFESRIRRFDESRRKQLDDQGRRMRKRIVDEIKLAVQNYARAQAFDAVVDSSGQTLNGVEVLLYLDAKVDITDDVLDILNKGAPEDEEGLRSEEDEKKADE